MDTAAYYVMHANAIAFFVAAAALFSPWFIIGTAAMAVLLMVSA